MDGDGLPVEEVLRRLDVGRRVAEEEREQLAAYFVETDQWRRIYSGEVDIVYGAKGSGKSAIYSVLLARTDEFFDRGVLLESAENPQGTPAFSTLIADPPTSEEEFVNLWKLYILSLVGNVIDTFGLSNDYSKELLAVLADAGLHPMPKGLAARAKAVLDYVRRVFDAPTIEGEVKLDPSTGAPVGIVGRIIPREPSATERAAGFVSLDDALVLADEAMAVEGYTLWMLFDRLDVAFTGSPDLERNALRALFKAYQDLMPYDHLQPKIFLRSDIWQSITGGGFREASHVTRSVTIDWDTQSLLNLLVRRLLQSEPLLEMHHTNPVEVLASFPRQEAFFYQVFPAKVDRGSRKPTTLTWMVGRTRDGTQQTAPRELIHLLSSARDVQMRQLELGQRPPEAGLLFTAQAIKDALPDVSKVRLEQTLFSEYPELKPYVQALAGGKTDHGLDTLAAAWSYDEEKARDMAVRLVEVGFFEERGNRQAPRYWIPFLYRPALGLVQGTAEE